MLFRVSGPPRIIEPYIVSHIYQPKANRVFAIHQEAACAIDDAMLTNDDRLIPSLFLAANPEHCINIPILCNILKPMYSIAIVLNQLVNSLMLVIS